ncbi:MAG: hypothetical protein ACYTEO_20000 [Planctomycetota bacterium]|jgi:hypothetical protein
MAEKIKIVDGDLEITKTGDSVVTTLTRAEVVGKKAEAQTKVDHLNIDLAEAQAEVVKWDDYLTEIDK